MPVKPPWTKNWKLDIIFQNMMFCSEHLEAPGLQIRNFLGNLIWPSERLAPRLSKLVQHLHIWCKGCPLLTFLDMVHFHWNLPLKQKPPKKGAFWLFQGEKSIRVYTSKYRELISWVLTLFFWPPQKSCPPAMDLI